MVRQFARTVELRPRQVKNLQQELHTPKTETQVDHIKEEVKEGLVLRIMDKFYVEVAI